jgi:hypothetical protein
MPFFVLIKGPSSKSLKEVRKIKKHRKLIKNKLCFTMIKRILLAAEDNCNA